MDSFVYLGAKLTWDNDSSEEIKRRMQLATGAFSDLKVVWRDKGIRLTTKVQLYYVRASSQSSSMLQRHGRSKKRTENESWHLK